MRPLKSKKDKLSEHVIIRLTIAEKEEILRRTKEERYIYITDYIRARLFVKRLKKHITVSDDYVRIFRTMDYNLTKIGINLNQIAHKLNAYNTYILTEENKHTFKDCLEQLKECFCVLGKFFRYMR